MNGIHIIIIEHSSNKGVNTMGYWIPVSKTERVYDGKLKDAFNDASKILLSTYYTMGLRALSMKDSLDRINYPKSSYRNVAEQGKKRK